MKDTINPRPNDFSRSWIFSSFAPNVAICILAALALATRPVDAANILLNTNFSANTGQAIATSWTYFDPPTVPAKTKDYWIGGPPTGGFSAPALSGSQYWKQWGAGYFPTANNVAGITQTFGSSAGSIYEAAAWMYTSSSDELGADCQAWIDVSFLDSGGNLLALYTSTNFNASLGQDNWFQFQVTNQCDLTKPIPTGDPYFTNYAVKGTVTNLVAPVGTAQIRYRFALLQVATEGGSCYFDDPELDLIFGSYPPVISNMFPQDMIFVPPSNGLSFNVSSPSGSAIDPNGIHLVLNGVDVSSNLVIGGSSSNRTVAYQGLQSNMTYNAFITATDALSLSSSASNFFQTTWVGIPPVLYLWEAEDFDFNGGSFIDFPDLCNAPGDANCYYGTVGTPGVDEQSNGESISHLYRPQDGMNIDVSGDFSRPDIFIANRTDYELNPFEATEWVNYTRDFSNGTYWIVGRLSTDITLSGTLTMSRVNSDSSLTPLGTFAIAPFGLGWTTFENVYLLDTNGNKANVTLNGKTTLQVTSGGNILPSFFALVEAIVDQPVLNGMYPTGDRPFEYTNTLSFKVSTQGSTFAADGIKVILDGFDVSSKLVVTGTASNETVVYPSLLPDATHTAIISATNVLGHGFIITNEFDTFYPNHYMVQASDFDYNGGQYFPIDVNNYNSPDWFPNAYQNFDATTNIDFQHTTIGGEQYPYRPDGIPQEQGHDYLTTNFVNSGAIEYDLGDFGPGDWANYTGNYPAGEFYIYVRTAGLGAFSMNLEKVTSGAGTTNQTVAKLGDWNGVGVNNSTYQWVPLTDDGSVAPTVVELGGVETLRITTTTGDCYPNYFMLVPANGILISASMSGSNALVSFPTQAGVVYRVFSRDVLGAGNWGLQASILGDGSIDTVTIPAGAAAQFYKVTAP